MPRMTRKKSAAGFISTVDDAEFVGMVAMANRMAMAEFERLREHYASMQALYERMIPGEAVSRVEASAADAAARYMVAAIDQSLETFRKHGAAADARLKELSG